MTDHLPECDMEIWMQEQMNDPYAPYWLEPPDDIECQCKKLRACEQRVFQEQIEGRQHDMAMAYLRGLDAAEAAVVYLRDERRQGGLDFAIDAIRALKEKS